MDFGVLMYFLDEDKIFPLDRLFTQAIGKHYIKKDLVLQDLELFSFTQ